MIIEKTKIPEVLIITPRVFEDNRSFFMETWNSEAFAKAGINADFVQDNHSLSVKNTLRGIHYQINQPQGKLVRVTGGVVFDLAVDLRKSSKSFGSWVGNIIDSENKKMLWIPPGFGHAFFVLSDEAELKYKCTNFYYPEFERCVAWNDAKLAVKWPLEEKKSPLLSAKDQQGVSLELADLYE